MTMLDEKQSKIVNLGEGMFVIEDTINDWVVKDSNDNIRVIANKFNAVSLVLLEEIYDEANYDTSTN
jgi:hypothetical protein